MAAVGQVPLAVAPAGSPSWQGAVALVLSSGGGPLDRLLGDLAVMGYRPVAHVGTTPPADASPPAVAMIMTDDVTRDALAVAESLRGVDGWSTVPLVWLVDRPDLRNVTGHERLVDELVAVPYLVDELAVRLGLLRHRNAADDDGVIRRGPLVVDPITYHASVDGRLLDLTYMEYELLRLLVGHPGRVYTREEILSLVWGYDYFGGMRTVDVHVRRLRAKLGDHAWLIETVRGVGYRLAQVRA